MARRTNTPKLTKAQGDLREQAASPRAAGEAWERGVSCVQYYPPAKKLVELGLARWRCNDPDTGWLVATDAGRAALSNTEGK